VNTVIDCVTAVLMLFGSLLALTAAIGLLRFTDTLSRMHSATKPQVIGLVLILTSAVVRLRGDTEIWMLVLVGLFTLLTAPVIAHLVGRVAFREQRHRDGLLIVNEMPDPPD